VEHPTADPSFIERLKATIVGTYREMPGLRLDVPQAGRLFGVSQTVCRVALDELVRRGDLQMPRDGQYTLGTRP
jgi:hypothetical protein